MEKVLIILRGVPGSGKTTTADYLSGLLNCVSFAADDYFSKSGSYKFDMNLLHIAHLECQSNVRKAMESQENTIIVHNTNTTQRELKPYFKMANEFQYEIISLIVENRHNHDNIHNVPTETLLKMKNRFDIKL